MKTQIRLLASFAAALIICDAKGLEPRRDINPALLYWQAFKQIPELFEAEAAQLAAGDPARAITAKERELAASFDAAFALIQRARAMTEPCDWGSDPADGPNAFTPEVILIRKLSNAGLLRARIALEDGRPEAMRDELLGISALGRNGASGGALVLTMVQVAIDQRILDFISANFDKLSPAIRADLATGLKGLPRRATVSDAVAVEKRVIHSWLIDQLQKRGDKEALERFQTLLEDMVAGEPHLADQIIKAAGGTKTGLIRYIRDTEPLYARAAALARAGEPDVRQQEREFARELAGTTNLVAKLIIPNFSRARLKELEFQSRLKRLPDAAP